MAAYSLSAKAADELDQIYEYSILNFGLVQARSYLDGLHQLFRMLADNPMLGRSAEQLAPSLRRVEYKSHVVFYRAADRHTLIVRVLHQNMDVDRHL